MMRRPVSVGVAPGTTTFQIRSSFAGPSIRAWDPYATSLVDLGEVDTRARIRWDLIGLIGGGSLVIALTAGLIANAVR